MTDCFVLTEGLPIIGCSLDLKAEWGQAQCPFRFTLCTPRLALCPEYCHLFW